MTQSIRDVLNNRPSRPTENAGLLLERYLPELEDGKKPKLNTHLQAVSATAVPRLYPAMFERHYQDVARINGLCTHSHEFRVMDRMIVGLGGESVRETGISLLPLAGVPFIPGSALKGLCHRYMRSDFVTFLSPQARGEQLDVIFGYQRGQMGSQGHITFHDAWYIPGSAPGNQPIARDRMTPHHADYYTSQGRAGQPGDFDQPTPVDFLSAVGCYLVAISAPDEGWAHTVMSVVASALWQIGIGAKTSSGYGRLQLQEEDDLTTFIRQQPATRIRDRHDVFARHVAGGQNFEHIRRRRTLAERYWSAVDYNPASMTNLD
jgi:CRISPR-associated protein Cmr6